MLGLLIALTGSTTLGDLRREFRITPHDKIIVDNAILRWKLVDKSRKLAMKDRFAIVIYMRNKRCVFLKLKMPSVGGEPVYCYNLLDNNIIESYDDVE